MSEPRKTVNVKKNMKLIIVIFVMIFVSMIVYLGYSVSVYGQRWFASPYNPRLENIKSNVTPGSILDAQGEKLAWTEDGERRYVSDKNMRQALSHVVGDNYGMTQGAELLYAKYLFGFDSSFLDRLDEIFNQKERRGNDVQLTIDANLTESISDYMGSNQGAAVVLNYKTGEILASVSKPNFDPLDIKDYADDNESTVLFNRATMGRYPPGSTFKIITTAAVLENPELELEEYTCTGETIINGKEVSCAGGEVHGKVDLHKAFTVSCNTYFATQALKLGANRLNEAAESCGYNYDFLFNDLVLYESEYQVSSEETDVALSGIGQYKDLVTPLHAAMIAGAVANDGVMMQPRMLAAVISPSGKQTYTSSAKTFKTAVSADLAEELKEMMFDVVKSGTGTAAAMENYQVAGKTGTAEYNDEDGKLREHGWFVGFIDSDEHPLAVAVILEGVGSGGRNAAPVAKKALDRAIDLGY